MKNKVIQSSLALLVLHTKKLVGHFNHLFMVFCPPKISPCLIDNVLDFRRKKSNKNLVQISQQVFLYGALVLAAPVAAKEFHPPGAKPPTPIVLLNAGEHLICGKSRDGKIELEDGTQFKALSAQALHVYEDWDYHDHLIFTPNTFPFGGSEFYITNLDKDHECIQANFLSAPYKDNEYTQLITHIDPFDGEIFVINGEGTETIWTVDRKGYDLLEGWEHGDHISVGMNDLWFEKMRSECQYVIINCDKPYLKHLRITPCYN